MNILLPWRRLTALSAVVAAVACGSAQHGPLFDASGLSQPAYGLRVSGDAQGFVGPGWRVDNVVTDRRGRVSPKAGPLYVSTRDLDLDGDGTIGAQERLEEPTFDLRLVSEADEGVMWVKAHPLLPRDATRDLEVILAGYVDSLGYDGDHARGAFFSGEGSRSRRFSASLIESSPFLLAGRPALSALIEVGELGAGPGARSSARIRLAIAKYGHLQVAGKVRGSPTRPDKPPELPWPVSPREGQWVVERTALLVVGYANRPTNFDRHLPAFDILLSRVQLSGATYALESPAAFLSAHAPAASSQSAEPVVPAPAAPPVEAAASGSAVPTVSGSAAPAPPASAR